MIATYLVLGGLVLGAAVFLALMGNLGSSMVVGCLGIGLVLIAGRSESRQARELVDACREAPASADGRLHHRYAGTRVAPHGVMGTIGNDYPTHAAVFVRTFVGTTDPDGRERVLAVLVEGQAPSRIGSRVDFCGHPAGEVYFWPREGHRTGLFGGTEYGQPRGPYPAVRWVLNTP